MKNHKRVPDFSIENDLLAKGITRVCGIDEAGRGAWAGPIVSAAVILNIKDKIAGIDDSKRIKPELRTRLYSQIKERAVSFGVGMATVDEINKHGIQTATYLSYQRAIEQIIPSPDFIIIDHYRLPSTQIAQMSVSFGDQTSLSIAAASILAKVERDMIMCKLSENELAYGFGSNFGYGTKAHQRAILKAGLCENHRVKFVGKLLNRERQKELFDN